jgi:hypothetical protein
VEEARKEFSAGGDALDLETKEPVAETGRIADASVSLAALDWPVVAELLQ